MKPSEAGELFRQLTSDFFPEHNVIFSNQSRMTKPKIPLVLLTLGNVRRPQAANSLIEDGIQIGYYQSVMPITIDLFTHGKAIIDDTGNTVAYANSAMDELIAFANYLNSPKCVFWSNQNDVSILIETEVQDLTGIVNDNNYEYRTRMEILFSFTQETEKYMGDTGCFTDVAIN